MDIQPALATLRGRAPFVPELALVLGSGLGALAGCPEARDGVAIPFTDLGFPVQTVQGHQGKIRVTSAPGGGTSVRLLFPASATLPTEPPPRERRTESWRGAGTVLIVDDEEGVRNVAQRLVTSIGFDARIAVDGVDALQVYEAHRDEIVVVLLDLTMPRMGGAETLAELRRRNATLPIVVTSGYSESELGVPFSDSAAVGFVQKPFARTVLVRALREAIGA